MRTIYYSEHENICNPPPEFIPTTFTFDGEEIVQNVWAGIECFNSYVSYYWDISSSGLFTTHIEGEQVNFYSHMKRTTHGLEKEITTNITLMTKEIQYHGYYYECELYGDGKKQHYNVKDEPTTSTLKIICEKKYGRNKII